MLARMMISAVLAILLGAVLSSCARDGGDKRISLLLDEGCTMQADVPRIVSGPTFVTTERSPSVDSDGDGTRDTYGPSDIVRIAVGYSEQVCGYGVLRLALRTGHGRTATRIAKYCGCGHGGVTFCYRVERGDQDADGLAIPANAVSLRTYDGIVPDGKHRSVASRPGHRADGSLPDITGPGLSGTPGIRGWPPVGDVYRQGQRIRLTASFTEFVVVDTSGGRPTLGLEVGDTLRHAVYVGDEQTPEGPLVHFHEETHLVHFEYEVREGDRDDDGIVRVPADELRIPPGSSIRDLSGNDAVVIWSVTSGRSLYIDGS